MSKVSTKPGVNPLLAKYLAQLASHPLRTKALTVGVLCFLQEVLANHFARVPSSKPKWVDPWYIHALAKAKVDSKAIKMALYGFLVSAPLGHVLVGALQRVFAGRTGPGAKVGQILASNAIVAPIQATVYLACMAVINGARGVDDVIKTVRVGFLTVVKVMWVSSPLSMAFAQTFLAPEMWVPFFNLVGFTAGTYFNTRVKQLKVESDKRKADEAKGKGKEE